MMRLLLALLALMGVVAQAAPAEARPCGQAAQVRLVTASAVVAGTLAAHATSVAPLAAPARTATFLPGPAMPALFLAPALAPSVRVKVDRARE